MVKLQRVNNIITLLLSLFISIGTFAQEKEKTNNEVRAKIVESQTKKAVSFARIINKSRHIGVYSDTLGIFTIQAYATDTILVSSIGYYPASIKVADSLYKQTKLPQIALIEHVYELGVVDINSLGTYQQFKYKVLHTKIPTSTTQEVIESIQKELTLIPKHPLKAEASIPLGSPVTALYMLFSKEGKQIKHFNKVLEEEKEQMEDEKSLRIVNLKYNSEIVSQATGLTDELLNQFMLYCKPANRFIVLSNDYEIYKQILDCYANFKHEVIENKALKTNATKSQK